MEGVQIEQHDRRMMMRAIALSKELASPTDQHAIRIFTGRAGPV
jgi:hypothetical protein